MPAQILLARVAAVGKYIDAHRSFSLVLYSAIFRFSSPAFTFRSSLCVTKPFHGRCGYRLRFQARGDLRLMASIKHGCTSCRCAGVFRTFDLTAVIPTRGATFIKVFRDEDSAPCRYMKPPLIYANSAASGTHDGDHANSSVFYWSFRLTCMSLIAAFN